MNNIFANIEGVRKEKGIKQTYIAEMLGITQGTYSGYVTQNQDIKYGKLLEIANKLGVPVIDLITYPQKYVLESGNSCTECKEKDEIIKNLNGYIDLLKKKV
jgi:transcriptional regulator with XRE-family HTH domain